MARCGILPLSLVEYLFDFITSISASVELSYIKESLIDDDALLLNDVEHSDCAPKKYLPCMKTLRSIS